jgi:hypothetical protein
VNGNRNRDFVIVLVCLAAWLGLQHLGYNEFGAVGKAVLGGAFRSVLSAQLALDAFEQEVRGDLTPQQCWDLLYRSCPQFGFSGIVLDLDDVKRQWGINAGWQVRIDIPGRGYISLWRDSGARSQGAAAVQFLDCVSRTLNQKMSNLEVVHQK